MIKWEVSANIFLLIETSKTSIMYRVIEKVISIYCFESHWRYQLVFSAILPAGQDPRAFSSPASALKGMSSFNSPVFRPWWCKDSAFTLKGTRYSFFLKPNMHSFITPKSSSNSVSYHGNTENHESRYFKHTDW